MLERLDGLFDEIEDGRNYNIPHLRICSSATRMVVAHQVENGAELYLISPEGKDGIWVAKRIHSVSRKAFNRGSSTFWTGIFDGELENQPTKRRLSAMDAQRLSAGYVLTDKAERMLGYKPRDVEFYYLDHEHFGKVNKHGGGNLVPVRS